MSTPTLEASRRLLAIIRVAFMMSVVILALVCMLPVTAAPVMMVYYGIIGLCAWVLVGMYLLRRKLLLTAEAVLGVQPNDSAALRRWQTGHILGWASGESIVVYGVLLHFLGFTVAQVIPFFIVGFLVILILGPSGPRPASSDSPIQRT